MATSPWIKHVMKYAKENNMKFGEALKKAGPSYKPQGNSTMEESSSKNTRKMRKSRGKKSSSKKGKTARKWW